MKKYGKKWSVLLLVLMLGTGMLLGCGADEVSKPPEVYMDDSFTLIIGEEKYEVTVGELMELPEITKEIVRLDDDGEVKEEYDVRGVLMDDLLSSLNYSMEDVLTIRMKAGDGYSVEVPTTIVKKSPIIVAFEIDGKPLKEGTRPVQIFIPDEEAMYWARNTLEIYVNMGEKGEIADSERAVSRIYFLETAIMDLETVDYDETDDAAVKVSDLFADIAIEGDVYLLAVDDFKKSEEKSTFLENYILIKGEDTPAFRGPKLPPGMHVRDLVWINTGTTGMLSVKLASEIFEGFSVDQDKGTNLMELLEKYKLEKAEKYMIEAADGFSVEVTYDDLANGILYIKDSGEVATRFNGLPKNTSVRDVLFIEALQ